MDLTTDFNNPILQKLNKDDREKVFKSLTETRESKMSENKGIHKKILKIMTDVGYIQKDGVNKFQRYKYVSEANIAEKARKAMIEHGVIAVPRVKQVDILPTSPTSSGNMQHLTSIMLEYTFIDVDDGSFITVSMGGQGTDTGDKGVYKATTGANKYVFMKLLQIPTGDDPEKDEEPKTEQPKTQPKPEKEFTPEQLVEKIFIGENMLLDAGHFKHKKNKLNARAKYTEAGEFVTKDQMAKVDYDKLHTYYKYLVDKYQRDAKNEAVKKAEEGEKNVS